ncbi:unnamed protein product [Hermetia illucens]|uniref:Major facilitator superfamily (MFS) profile domain-containing protein n=2 Tax=Hermetia illucens TaxID=343691 RepID=A0A7R8YUV1_HERIL|nr:unnamed protein product [Hermetia illucens]
MVLEPKALKSKKISNECLVNATSDLSPTKIGPDLNTGGSNLTTVSNILENSFSQSHPEESDKKIKYNWDESIQGMILGAFYWMHWATQFPGGVLAKKYGTKLVFGLGNVIACWMCFIAPMLARWDYRALIIFRVLQGFVIGVAWPSMHNMTGQWIPPNERSKFVTAYMGCSIGIAIFYPLFGYIIEWLSWEWIFYSSGIIGSVWYIFWVLFVFDSPAQHPRITNEEREYIEGSLKGVVEQQKSLGKVPWTSILTSKVVWLNVIAMWGSIWGLFTLMTQAPTYFKYIHGWGITMTGVLSGIPHLMRVIFAYCFSTFGDWLLRNDKMERSYVRKLATFTCCCVNGFLVLGLAYSGCNSTAAIILLTTATAVHGAITTGPLSSMVDISPNYASIVFGISNTITVLPGFISAAIVGYLTLGNQTVTSWKYVFFIAAGMLIICGMIYVIFCKTTIQSWNTAKKDDDIEEMEKLNYIKNEGAVTTYEFPRGPNTRANY